MLDNLTASEKMLISNIKKASMASMGDIEKA